MHYANNKCFLILVLQQESRSGDGGQLIKYFLNVAQKCTPVQTVKAVCRRMVLNAEW
jgi:hypothetical protein